MHAIARRPFPRPLSLFLMCGVVLLSAAAHAQGPVAEADAIPATAAPPAQADAIRPSIVKIHATIRNPELFRPWAKAAPQQGTGSGVVISGNRIITNAHVVRYASQVYVQPYQSANRLPAKIQSISYAMDMAILELEDESFFEGRRALEFFDGLPKIKDKVNAYGYPTGGEELSITEGIVSRIEIGPYAQGALGLVIQVDAALNPGNSGGAVMIGGKIAGIVRSGIPSAENIGYLIPVEEILTFLHDVEDGTYDGKYRLDLGLQTTDNPALRERLGLNDTTTGLMVARPKGDDNPLKEWDVITHIAGHDIQNDGQVRLNDDLRVAFHYHIDREAKDGKLPVTVFREGKSLTLDIPVSRESKSLLPSLQGEYPRYYIYGPLTFSQATQEVVSSLPMVYRSSLMLTKSPLMVRATDDKEADDEELVIVSTPMFPHRITKGYDSPMLGVVSEVNGQKIQNLAGLVKVMENADGPFIEIKFASERHEHIVFKREELLAAMDDILTDNGIRSRSSNDLRDLLRDE